MSRRPYANQPYYIKRDKLRSVWAYVTSHPCATLDEIAAGTGIGRPACVQAMRVLIAAGYVEHLPRTKNSRRVIIPLVTLGEGAQIVKHNDHA